MANKNTSKTRRRPSKAELERKQAIQRLSLIHIQLDEATKERIDTAYKEMNEHVGLKW